MMHDQLVDRDLAVVVQVFARGGSSQKALLVRLKDHVAVLVVLLHQACRPALPVYIRGRGRRGSRCASGRRRTAGTCGSRGAACAARTCRRGATVGRAFVAAFFSTAFLVAARTAASPIASAAIAEPAAGAVAIVVA